MDADAATSVRAESQFLDSRELTARTSIDRTAIGAVAWRSGRSDALSCIMRLMATGVAGTAGISRPWP